MMSLEEIKKLNEGTMMETLGIEYIDVKEGYVCARMMVRPDLSQPYGMLHGGASMALAASVAPSMHSDAVLVDIRQFH